MTVSAINLFIDSCQYLDPCGVCDSSSSNDCVICLEGEVNLGWGDSNNCNNLGNCQYEGDENFIRYKQG